MYAIIDVETTGGQARFERITEIAVVLHDGEKVVDSFSTLLNPERSIPWSITQLTGITDDMVASAPKFYEVARRIVEMTEGKIFVAHNVSFDYHFVREEFARLGFEFSRKQLCTVRLARKVFPGLQSYSLGNLKRHFGIHADQSHRALDDTLATARLFELILAEQSAAGSVRQLVNRGVRETKLPPAISLDRLHEIPSACGVYYFHNAAGDVIYVGKSLNIQKRLFEHFSDPTAKGEKLRAGVTDLSYEVTGSELVALLLESAEIKRLQPPVNRALRNQNFVGGIFAYTDARGYRCLAPGKITARVKKGLELVAEFPKLDHARNQLQAVARQFELCDKLCNLDFSGSSCFHYNIKLCRGACVAEESTDDYNERVEHALLVLDKRLSGSFFIVEPGRTAEEKALIGVQDGRFLGYAFVDSAEGFTTEDLLEAMHFPGKDPDAGKIIRGYMSGKRKAQVMKF